MAEVTASIVVRAPLERTFQYIADYSRALEWMDGMSEFTLVGTQARGVGARVRAVHYVLGLAVPIELRIVEYVENEKLVSVSTGPVRSVSTWRVEPVEGGTRVSFRGDYRIVGIPVIPFADSILKSEVGGHITRSLRNLRRRLEVEADERQADEPSH